MVTCLTKLAVASIVTLVALWTCSVCNVCVEARQSTAFRPRQQSSFDAISLVHQQQQQQHFVKQKDVSTRRVDSSSIALSLFRGGAVQNNLPNALMGAVVMALIEKAVNLGFQTYNIKFPSQLAACLVLFVFLLLTEAVDSKTANNIFTALSPGSQLLAKWLPVFFVPGLAMFPLAPSIGDVTEKLKVLVVVGLGFFFTIITTGYAVLGLRKTEEAFARITHTVDPTRLLRTDRDMTATPKHFDDRTMKFFTTAALLTAIPAVLAHRINSDLAVPLQTLFLGLTTVASYVFGARLPADITQVVHPLVTSCLLLLGTVELFGLATNRDFMTVLKSFRTNSLHPMKAGAGDVLLYLLGPSVVSFAVSMYSRRRLLKDNWLVILVAMLVSSLGGLFGTAGFVRLIQLGGAKGSLVRLSVLSRNVTTALAIAVTELLGGDISIAASVVVLTGILGATIGKYVLMKLEIKDPVTRGLAIGASSQGLGVASMSNEQDAFPFAAISMICTAIFVTTLVSVPLIRDTLVNLATGQ